MHSISETEDSHNELEDCLLVYMERTLHSVKFLPQQMMRNLAHHKVTEIEKSYI